MASVLVCDGKHENKDGTMRECDTKWEKVTHVSIEIRSMRSWPSGAPARLNADLCEVHVAGIVGFLKSRGLEMQADV